MKNKNNQRGFKFYDLLKFIAPNGDVPAKRTLPSFAGVLEVKHYISGRLRVRIPSMKGDSRLAEYIVKALSPVRGIDEVSANPLLGTALVKFDETLLSPEIVITALSHCFDFGAAIKSRRSIFGNELKLFRFSLDQAVMQKTLGLFDLRSAVSLLLMFQLARGLSKWRRGAPVFNGNDKQPFPIALVWWLLQTIGHERMF